MLRALFITFAVVFSLPAVSAAQSTDDEARRLFDEASAAVEAGRYEEAYNKFRRSHELSGRPALLFNMGVAADRMRRDGEALELFERYLREEPNAPNAADVHGRIAVLRADGSGSGGSEAGPVPWIFVGVGGALVITGAILVGVGVSDAGAAENAPMGASWEDYRVAHENAPVLSGVGFALLGVGAAAAVGGLAWALVGSGGGSSESAEIRFDGQTISLAGSF